MAHLLTASMTADAPAADDIPSKPIYTAFDDDDETEEDIKPKKPAPQPSPAAVPASAKPKAVVDTSKVHAGVIVKHKAFGLGQVKGMAE